MEQDIIQIMHELQKALEQNNTFMQELMEKINQPNKTEKEKYIENNDRIKLIKQNIYNLNKDQQNLQQIFIEITNHLRTHQIIIGYTTGNTQVLQKQIARNIQDINEKLQEAIKVNQNQQSYHEEIGQSLKNNIN